jgi:hypothetical protein
MALFGSDRPVMPSFKTSPDLDSSARGPYDDLNRLDRNGERNPDRNADRNPDRNGDRNPDRNGDRNAERSDDRNPDRSLARQLDSADERNGADVRAQDRLERVLERAAAAPVKSVQQAPRRIADGTHPLIEGLFSKLPEPESQWPLAARQKWLQTAASIFDLMYVSNESDAGELAIRVERTSAR